MYHLTQEGIDLRRPLSFILYLTTAEFWAIKVEATNVHLSDDDRRTSSATLRIRHRNAHKTHGFISKLPARTCVCVLDGAPLASGQPAGRPTGQFVGFSDRPRRRHVRPSLSPAGLFTHVRGSSAACEGESQPERATAPATATASAAAPAAAAAAAGLRALLGFWGPSNCSR